MDGMPRKSLFGLVNVLWLILPVLTCSSTGWCQDDAVRQTPNNTRAAAQRAQAAKRQAAQQVGTISGKVVDQSGAEIAGAIVKLKREGQSSGIEVTTNDDGLFAFTVVAPGPFHITVSSAGLSPQEFSGTLQPGQAFVTPLIMLIIPTQVTEVRVLPPDELAEMQVKEQEKQRVLRVIPNFYVSYVPDAAPLRPKQKFELAWKSAIDPATLAGVGIVAGLSQAGDRWPSYGQGMEGYAKRYGTAYVDVFGATFIGGAILPSVLKQDPRYYYRGKGSKHSRLLYALANSVICKGDNGHWQPNYSTIGGSFAAGALENVYYPPKNRTGASLVVSGGLTRIGEISLAGVLQEFVFPKLSPDHSRAKKLDP